MNESNNGLSSVDWSERDWLLKKIVLHFEGQCVIQIERHEKMLAKGSDGLFD